MVTPRFLIVAGLLLAATLAGCSGGKTDDVTKQAIDDGVDEVTVKATADTGVIRGVVVDEAIRPVASALITVKEGDAVHTTNTTASGAFGIQGLKPGTYFVKAHKLGFTDTQTSVEVKAGDSNPPVTHIGLTADASFIKPYVAAYAFKGFIECGVTTPVVAGAVCSFANNCLPATGCVNATNDNFAQFIDVPARPQYIQHELVWESTQAGGPQFNLAMRTATQQQSAGGNYEAAINGTSGNSPLVGRISLGDIKKFDLGLNGTGLAPAVFAGGVQGTGDQVCPPGTPITKPFCLFDTGATIEQDFDLYTHVFFGFSPPADWQFSKNGEPKAPL